MTFQEAISWARTYGPQLSVTAIRTLLAKSVDHSPLFLLTHPNHKVEESAFQMFERFIKKLSEGMPLSRILGEREFWSLSFRLNQETLDPRSDSECLIDAVIQKIPDRSTPLRILDLGTGTGCLLISLLFEYPHATGVGVDISKKAIEAAKGNAERLLQHLERVTFIQSNWFETIPQEPFDIIISNPPYITKAEYQTLDKNVKDYDPKNALVGGDDGLQDYRKIIKKAGHFLSPYGHLILEIGYTQKDSVTTLLEENHFQVISTHKDLAGINRCLWASLCL